MCARLPIANSPLGTTSTPQGATYLDYRYQFNDVSNITQRQTEHGTYQYGYDDLDRLTQVVPPPVIPNLSTPITALPIEAYTYDAVHNRKTSSHQTGNQANAWLVNANNQLTQWGDASGTNPAQPRVTQTYDANGHLLTKTVTPEDRSQAAATSQRYRYNLAERLIQITDSSQAEIASYSYDPFGRRIRKTVSQASSPSTPLGTTTYLYADEGLLAEADTSGNITTTYGWIPNGIWGTAPQWKADVTMGSSGTAALTYHYFHNDHLGTSQRLTNDQGVLTWSARMEAFGKTTTIDSIITNLVNGQSQTALMPTTTVNNLRFAGQIEDPETGTFYNYKRDYDLATGGYIQSDPIGLHGGINTYAYVAGKPLTHIDPFGLAGCKWVGPVLVCEWGPAPVPTPGDPGVAQPGWSFPDFELRDWWYLLLNDRTIPKPKKPACGCTCICRADANDNISGNIKPGDLTFAFGEATEDSCAKASKVIL